MTGPRLSIAPSAAGETDEQRQTAIRRTISERNARPFEAEADEFDGWLNDLKLGLERELKEMDRQSKKARRAAATGLTLEEKLAGQKQTKALEYQRTESAAHSSRRRTEWTSRVRC